MTNVVCIGECMIEMGARRDGRYELGFAGDALNTAVYLKRSAPQFTVRFLTVTGVDEFSRRMHASWDAEGIARDLVFTVDDAVPGLYIIDVDDSGERNFTYWRSASPARRWLDILLREGGAARLAGADLIYFSGISLAILPEAQRSAALQLLSTAQQRGARIAFDPNYRRALWASSTVARETLGAAIRLADIVLPSEEDLTSAGLVKSAHRELVITYGSRGCSILVDGAQRLLDAPVVAANDVVDTSGAGDSFNGTYLAARLMDADPSTAATAALAVAARVVTASGAIVPREVSHPTR